MVDFSDIQDVAKDAALTASALLEGLKDSHLLADSSYDARRRVAKFKIAGGGAAGEFFPDLRIWLEMQLDKNLRISWEKTRAGAVVLHFSGLSFAPLPGAQELYVKAGLDAVTCPSLKSVSQEEYYQCHLKKALLMEDFWKANRTLIPKNLQHQFAFIGDNTIISHLSEQLGHGFGWSMLLVLSAPPSVVDTLEFSDNGVRGTSVHDKNQAGAKLSAKHGFKDLSLNIARPLVGDTRFGGLVRSVGERIMPVACNFGILCSVGEPRWRSKGIRGADPKVVASMFRRKGSKGPHGEEGCLTWKKKRRRCDIAGRLSDPTVLGLRAAFTGFHGNICETKARRGLERQPQCKRLQEPRSVACVGLRIGVADQPVRANRSVHSLAVHLEMKGKALCRLDLLGSDLPMPGSEVAAFRWSDGALLRALKRGDWVLLDEINLAPQATLEGLNALLDHRREVFLPAIGQTVSAHPGFRLFAAQNPVATGGGRKGLPRSFLNRFTRVVLSQLSAQDLRHICRHAHGSALGDEVVDRAVRLVEELQLASRGASEEGPALIPGGKCAFGTPLPGIGGTPVCYDLGKHAFPAAVLLRSSCGFGGIEEASCEPCDSRSGVGHETPVLCLGSHSLQAQPQGLQVGSALLRQPLQAADVRGFGASEHLRHVPHLTALAGQRDVLHAMAHAVSNELKWPLLLVGGPGAGKHSLVRWLAAMARMPLQEVPLTPAMDASELLGCFEQVDARGLLHQLARWITAAAFGLRRAQESLPAATALNLDECFRQSALLEKCLDQKAPLPEAMDKAEVLVKQLQIASSQMDSPGAKEPSDFGAKLLAAARARMNSAGRFEWVDGPLVTAMVEGSWVLLSHAEQAAPAVLDRLNSLLEPNGFLLPDAEPHPDFRVFFTLTTGCAVAPVALLSFRSMVSQADERVPRFNPEACNLSDGTVAMDLSTTAVWNLRGSQDGAGEVDHRDYEQCGILGGMVAERGLCMERNVCKMRKLRVVAGDWKQYSDDEAVRGQSVERRIKRVFSHPQYDDAFDSDFDMAVLELDKPFPINECIGVACLPTMDDDKDLTGAECSITGWGTLMSSGPMPEVLQEASVTLLSMKECEEDYAKHNETITASMLCAAGNSEKGITDTCQGDSGGPLVCEESGHYIVRGVTSWGDGCALEGYPGVYARVSSALGWIRDIMDGKVETSDTSDETAPDIAFGHAMWTVLSGSCTVDDSDCLVSPGYPGNYSNKDDCRIAVNTSAATPLQVESFSTEAGYDSLLVNCKAYSGSVGPEAVVPDTTIYWYSDGSVVSSGWRICPSDNEKKSFRSTGPAKKRAEALLIKLRPRAVKMKRWLLVQALNWAASQKFDSARDWGATGTTDTLKLLQKVRETLSKQAALFCPSPAALVDAARLVLAEATLPSLVSLHLATLHCMAHTLWLGLRTAAMRRGEEVKPSWVTVPSAAAIKRAKHLCDASFAHGAEREGGSGALFFLGHGALTNGFRMPPAELQQVQLEQVDLRSPVDLLLSLIIRPPRCRYTPTKLGPSTFRIADKGHGRREDLVLQNPRGQSLQCSLFEPIPEPGQPEENWSSMDRPCVIFLHGNSSCRLEALPLLPLLLPLRISLFCFDFAGCGISEGDYVSLGWFEREDLATCIAHLRATGKASQVALWGRSMGAVTALLHADRDPSIAALVLDSPFASLRDLATDLAGRKAMFPSWATRAIIPGARAAIRARAGFDIEDLEGKSHARKCFMPALFIAARGDDFITPWHAEELCQAYHGEKEFYLTEGDHHSSRSVVCRQKATLFLCRAFHAPRLDALLELHTAGLSDLFGPGLPKPAQGKDLEREGAEICWQMRLVPALGQMALCNGKRCQRPVTASAVVELGDSKAEVGFFIRLVPAEGVFAKLDELGQPRFLVVSFTSDMSMVSRVHSDTLRTLAVGPGLHDDRQVGIGLTFDLAGNLSLHVDSQQLLAVDVGKGFRAELTLWLMRLRGKNTFGGLVVEDAEATLCEHLGDAVLRSRHLGHAEGVLLLNRRSLCRPLGDLGLTRDTRDPCSPCSPSDLETKERTDAARRCAQSPEVLIGWRVKVSGLGEGVVTGLRRRHLRPTLFKISGLGQLDGPSPVAKLREVPLRRQAPFLPCGGGYHFELMRKEVFFEQAICV
ncbi:mdn1 [Symbiodinium natans]|uniref:Mdn1 protein n=1 Tax=Symbiodinium natans TaxID=878477 RepID=A0A812NHP2_9DINO|nr:mdn1 [Symbiodinium natans]